MPKKQFTPSIVDGKLKRLSPSSMKTWQMCQWRWAAEKVFRLPSDREGGSTFVGTCFDRAVNHNYQQKIDSHRDLARSEIKEHFADSFDSGRDDINWGGYKPGVAKDIGVDLVDQFADVVFPRTQPTQVQGSAEIELGGVDYTLATVVDVVAVPSRSAPVPTNEFLIDNKTSRKKMSDKDANLNWQGAAYELWYMTDRGHQSQGFRFDIAIKNDDLKTPKPGVQQIDRKVTTDEVRGFLKILGTMHSQIQDSLDRGLFVPDRNHFLCSRQACPFWKYCEMEHGWKINDTKKAKG